MSVTASSDAVPATEVLAEARAVGASQRGRLRTPVDIEVVIPAYNESARLPETLRQSVAYLDRQPWRSRLVVVDNGSVDETAADARIAAACTDKVGVTVIGCSRAGKGAAVRRGLLTSTSPLVGFFDADLATPLETLEPTVEALRAGADAVIASRHADGSSFVIPSRCGAASGATCSACSPASSCPAWPTPSAGSSSSGARWCRPPSRACAPPASPSTSS